MEAIMVDGQGKIEGWRVGSHGKFLGETGETGERQIMPDVDAPMEHTGP